MTNLKKTSFAYFFYPLAIFCFLVGPAYSQTEETFELKTNPEVPGPRESVTAFVASFSIDLDLSNISWKVGGVPTRTGIGEKRITLAAPDAGETIEIEATVIAPTGISVTKKIILEPLTLDLLWEASDSYAPPFYKGKVLPGEGAVITVFAVPGTQVSGGTLLPETISYTWSRNGSVVGSASGYGKRDFKFQMDYLNQSERIEVEAQDNSGRKMEASLVITPTNPLVLLYEHFPLSGIQYGRALGNPFPLRGAETTLVAEPFFFSPRKKGGPLQFLWRVNERAVTPGGRGDSLTVRAESSEPGEANIFVSVANAAKILQKAERAFSIRFNQHEE